MQNIKYTFTERKICDKLKNGLYRIYFNEEESLENNGDASSNVSSITVWKYNVIDIKELTKSNIVSKLIRTVYSIDDELALLRQRDTKVEEFEKYNSDAEQFKTIADNVLKIINE